MRGHLTIDRYSLFSDNFVNLFKSISDFLQFFFVLIFNFPHKKANRNSKITDYRLIFKAFVDKIEDVNNKLRAVKRVCRKEYLEAHC